MLNSTMLGRKHFCQHCNARFYDLGNAQAQCPKCLRNIAEDFTLSPAHNKEAPGFLQKTETTTTEDQSPDDDLMENISELDDARDLEALQASDPSSLD